MANNWATLAGIASRNCEGFVQIGRGCPVHLDGRGRGWRLHGQGALNFENYVFRCTGFVFRVTAGFGVLDFIFLAASGLKAFVCVFQFDSYIFTHRGRGSGGQPEVLNVLYLFAGRSRRSSLANYLKQAGKIHNITVIVKEVDILQNKRKHDLTNGARRRHYMELIRNGGFDFVAASPPCNTFSRARGANTQGPITIRSKRHPRGLPDLTWKENEELGKANVLVDFTAEALEAQLEINDSMALLEHPEDLGAGN